jgi:cell division protease FtsH
LEHADEVHKVTIIPRGRAGGYVIMLPKEDRMLITKNELLDRVCGLLAGRVAEELFIGEIGTGAYSDFKQATGIVRSMIMEYGMSDRLGPMQFGNTQGQVFLGRDLGHEQNYSDQIAYEIDQEMQTIINGCYERTKQLLTEKSKEMHLIANTLLEVETLEIEQIKALITTGELPEAYSRGGIYNSNDDSNNSTTDAAEDAEVTTSEPIIDEIGDVKVRIQKREQEDPTTEQGIVEEKRDNNDDKKE